MPATITVEEAQAHLKELIDKLAPGEEIGWHERAARPSLSSSGKRTDRKELHRVRRAGWERDHAPGGRRRAPEETCGIPAMRYT